MTEDVKLTVRVPRRVLDEAKRYARQHDTTLSRLISEYLRRVSLQGDVLADAPIVRRLSGILPQEATIDEYKRHIEDKYGES